jgi:inner membrane transporter RhtA
MVTLGSTCQVRGVRSKPIALRAAPPHVFFVASAVFHYLGPAFAVLLFAYVAPLGVAWLRIAAAAVVFAVWRRPWRFLRSRSREEVLTIAALGVVIALMNCCFYQAIAALPLGTVGAIEFLGPIGIAVFGIRTRRNLAAFLLATAGVYSLTRLRIAGEPLGYLYAFANCALFALYVVLGHRAASSGAGVDRLAAAMLVAFVVALPIGIADAAVAFARPTLLGAAIGVGICSSVIPYVCDQLAMAALPRATFALLLALLPATAAAIGVVVLRQFPSSQEILGVALVAAGVAVHAKQG